jgi:hypoxanthine phosphoribosyltransferase
MRQDIAEVLVDENALQSIVARLGKQINEDYAGKNLCMVCVLKGSLVFMGDLLKYVSIPMVIDAIKVSSYGGGTQTSGEVKILFGLSKEDLSGMDILLIEDIVDSGKTMEKLVPMLLARGASSVRVCTLLNKKSRRVVNFEADYVGIDIPDAFVVGYGLDYDEKYRNLPFVGILKPSVYGG